MTVIFKFGLKMFCKFQVLLSGGVDSTVCTALLNKALNQDQVIAVHIDNGFMRKRESQSVEEALTKLGINVKGTLSLSIINQHIAYTGPNRNMHIDHAVCALQSFADNHFYAFGGFLFGVNTVNENVLLQWSCS